MSRQNRFLIRLDPRFDVRIFQNEQLWRDSRGCPCYYLLAASTASLGYVKRHADSQDCLVCKVLYYGMKQYLQRLLKDEFEVFIHTGPETVQVRLLDSELSATLNFYTLEACGSETCQDTIILVDNHRFLMALV